MVGLSEELNQLAADVEPSSTSISKWNAVRDLIAEALGCDPEEVYATTVSGAKQAHPRLGQDPADHPMAIAMCPAGAAAELAGISVGVESHVARKDYRRMVLIFAEGPSGWTLKQVLKRPGESVPKSLTNEWPGVLIVDV